MVRAIKSDPNKGHLPVSVALAKGLRLESMSETDELVFSALLGHPEALVERLEMLKTGSSDYDSPIDEAIALATGITTT